MQPVLKTPDVAYVRLRAPDLAKMEKFLTDFGMTRAARDDNALYMRGTDATHHIHVTEKGEAGFIGIAFWAGSAEALEAATGINGASGIEAIDAPGGGKRVCVRDPNGFQIEIVHGIETLEPLPVPNPLLHQTNTGVARVRKNAAQRIQSGPAHVKRLGHIALNAADYKASLDWYQNMLGLLVSDHVHLETKEDVVASFLRCNRGAVPCDHHTIFVQQGENSEAGLNHMGFEVNDFDDVGVGQQHLRNAGYAHLWGIGRHTLGSQIYDYWRDPWGNGIEHWTDGDLLSADVPTGLVDGMTALLGQWGSIPPDTFGKTIPPDDG